MFGTEFILVMMGLGLIALGGIALTVVLIKSDTKCKYLQSELTREIALNGVLNDENNRLKYELENIKTKKES
jgi:hypothetical protein